MTNNAQKNLKLLLKNWVWDMLYTLDGQKNFIEPHGFARSDMAELIGADQWFQNEETEQASENNEEEIETDEEEIHFNPIRARKLLKEHFQEWQREHDFETLWKNGVPEILRDNIAQWITMFDLNMAEERILTFVILLHTNNDLPRWATILGELHDQDAYSTLSALLRLPESAVIDALQPRGKLNSIGILSLDRESDYYLRSKIDLLSRRFAELMMSTRLTPTEILKQHILPAPNTELNLKHFQHLGVLPQAILAHLKSVLEHHQKGCNILIHGAAGTGKTEFTRVIAQTLNVELFEISWADDNDRPTDRGDRMNAFRMAQNILAGQNNILMFDEIEDLFDRGQSDFSLNKAWLNRMLEKNAVPTIWICNNVHLMDASAVRRFDIILEMKTPPLSARVAMIQKHVDDFLNENQIRAFAENEAIVPAILKRAHKITQAVPDWENAQKGELFQKLVQNTLKAQGYSDALRLHGRLPEIYDVAWIHCKQDLQRIAQGVAKNGRGTLCLYGASGTGKSAFAAWLAQEADKPLIYKRGSDLLGKYVGETEQRIAAAFDEARENQAVLVFDEVDSFLQDRRSARQSWEITQVNEMLTQMEAYDGIFIASTNLMKHLDQAALRRFDFKMEFLYLRGEQAWGLFQAHCAKMNLAYTDDLKVDLLRIQNLALGDFAVVSKQAKIMPFENAAAFLRALQSECALKEGAKGAMGFF